MLTPRFGPYLRFPAKSVINRSLLLVTVDVDVGRVNVRYPAWHQVNRAFHHVDLSRRRAPWRSQASY